MSPGTQTSPSEAVARMAAGAWLEAMRRPVRLSRMTVWNVIAAGPITLCVAVTATPTTAKATAGEKPTAVRSSADDATSAQARLALPMAPNSDLPSNVSKFRDAPYPALTK